MSVRQQVDYVPPHSNLMLFHFHTWSAIDPHDVNALTNKGAALNGLGNHTGAIVYYDKALAIDPHNVLALNNKGVVLDNLGNHTGAIQYYDKALAIDPHNVLALTNKGAGLDGLSPIL